LEKDGEKFFEKNSGAERGRKAPKGIPRKGKSGLDVPQRNQDYIDKTVLLDHETV